MNRSGVGVIGEIKEVDAAVHFTKLVFLGFERRAKRVD